MGVLSVDVDITSFVPYQFKSEFVPIEIDLSYGSGVKVDEKLSVNKHTFSFNEWSDRYNISLLTKRQMSRKNHNSGIPSAIKESFSEKVMKRFFKD